MVMALRLRAGIQQSGLIDQVLQVSTRKTCGALCDDPEGDIGSQRLILGVDLEDLLAALDIGQAHIDLTVKAARTEQGLIQNVGTVVAAITMTPSLASKPSISTSSWFRVCSRSSWPRPDLRRADGPRHRSHR